MPRTLQYWLHFKKHIFKKENIRKTIQGIHLHLEKSAFRDILVNLIDVTPMDHVYVA